MQNYTIEQHNLSMSEKGMEFFVQTSSPQSVCAKPHIHDSIEIILFQEGSFRIMVNDTEYQASQGELILFRSNTIHFITSNSLPANRYCVLKIKPSLFFDLASEKNAVSYALRFILAESNCKTLWTREEVAANGTAALYDQLALEANCEPLCQDISMKLYAFQIVLALLRDMIRDEGARGVHGPSNDNTTAQIYQTIRLINKRYAENLNAHMCADQASMSYSYFSRCFKNVTGKSFKEYLNIVRINHAQRLLTTTTRSVTQIALECGYNNISYFIAVYKSLKGETPLASRRLHHI